MRIKKIKKIFFLFCFVCLTRNTFSFFDLDQQKAKTKGKDIKISAMIKYTHFPGNLISAIFLWTVAGFKFPKYCGQMKEYWKTPSVPNGYDLVMVEGIARKSMKNLLSLNINLSSHDTSRSPSTRIMLSNGC